MTKEEYIKKATECKKKFQTLQDDIYKYIMFLYDHDKSIYYDKCIRDYNDFYHRIGGRIENIKRVFDMFELPFPPTFKESYFDHEIEQYENCYRLDASKYHELTRKIPEDIRTKNKLK